MQDFDFTLKDLGIVNGNFDEEILKLHPELQKEPSEA